MYLELAWESNKISSQNKINIAVARSTKRANEQGHFLYT